MPKKVPKYLRNSRDQAICKAICLSLISFCIISCLSSWGQNKWQSVVTHLLNLSPELICLSRGFSFFNCFDLSFIFNLNRLWLKSFCTAIPNCHLGSEVFLECIHNRYEILFLCPKVLYAIYSLELLAKPKIYVQLIVSHMREDLYAFKCRYISLAFMTICTEIILPSNSIQFQIEIHLEYQVHIIPYHDTVVEGYYFETSVEIFPLTQISCCLKSFVL